MIAKFTPKVIGSYTNWELRDASASTSDRIYSQANLATHLYVRSGNVFQAEVDAGTLVSSTEAFVGGSFAENDFSAVINGGAVSTDAGGIMPVNIDEFLVGPTFHGHLKYLKYVNYAETDAELVTDTTA